MRKSICISVLFFLPHFFCAAGEVAFASLEDEYTPNYCLQLEAAYGEGMMSEGGIEGIEWMFDDVSLNGKTALDIGSGLGGVPFYLAEKYGMMVTGLEVNPWMVGESKRRTPPFLKNRVDFLLSSNNNDWPIPTGTYDLVYSKGVLTHLETKDEIFQECSRVLKTGGLLVITDWLSSNEKKWGENIAQLVELESLVLYPESELGYIDLLKRNGYTVLSVRDDSSLYLGFNKNIVKHLKDLKLREIHLTYFDDLELSAAVTGYEAIARAIETGELRVIRFIAQK